MVCRNTSGERERERVRERGRRNTYTLLPQADMDMVMVELTRYERCEGSNKERGRDEAR